MPDAHPGPLPRLRFAIIDIDDVLLETAAALNAASRAMLVPLSDRLGQRSAVAVQQEFARCMGILQRRLWAGDEPPAFDDLALMERVAYWQRGVTDAGFEVKAWSRHALLACALEAYGLPVSGVVVAAAVDRYWAVAADAALRADAVALVRRLGAAGVAIHLATGSDGFLTFDDARRTFVYAPRRSERLKRRRLRRLASLGFRPADITIGDPIGKPEPAFYRSVLSRFSVVLGQEVDPACTVAVGDSLGNDILPLLELGVSRGIWLLSDGSAPQRQADPGDARVAVVSSLDAEQTWRALSA
jgi:beta-phosphoglucomutase-like phosphatase (HAD superfamily)